MSDDSVPQIYPGRAPLSAVLLTCKHFLSSPATPFVNPTAVWTRESEDKKVTNCNLFFSNCAAIFC